MLELKFCGWKEELSVIFIKVVVQEKGGDESTERGSVHDEQKRTENRALGNITGGDIQGREIFLLHLTWKERDDK